MRDEEAEVRRELLQLLQRLVDRLDAVVEVEGLAATLHLALESELDRSSSYSPTVVRMGRRPSGGVSMIEMSRSPESDMCSVRGIGVALNVSTSTSSRRARSSSFCATPKRCSSSRMTSPRSFGMTSRLQDPVRADQDVDLAVLEVREHLLDFSRGPEPRDHLDANREVAVALAERVPMLLGENRRRREHQRLPAVDGNRKRGADRDLGLAEADVAAHEAVHRPGRLQVFLHRFDRSHLVRCLSVRELRLEPLEVFVTQVVGHARSLLPLRVEREQLAGELSHRLPRAVLEVVPRLAAELRERGRGVVRADVARHLAELLVRDVEPVVASEAEEEVVARDAGDLLGLEAEQLPDAVVLVDDEVAAAEIRERLQRATADSPLTRRPLAEDLRVRQQDEARSRQTKPRRAGVTANMSPASRGSSSPSATTRASMRRSRFFWRSASPRCGKATTTR